MTSTAPGWQCQPLVATSSAALFGAIAPQTDLSVTATSSSPTVYVNVESTSSGQITTDPAGATEVASMTSSSSTSSACTLVAIAIEPR
ncbi:MAG: hypothetical protein ACM31C_25725 [Acidobacteriota bacterium]